MTTAPINQDALDELTALYLKRLADSDCESSDQPLAATVIGEKIRRMQNTLTALQQGAR